MSWNSGGTEIKESQEREEEEEKKRDQKTYFEGLKAFFERDCIRVCLTIQSQYHRFEFQVSLSLSLSIHLQRIKKERKTLPLFPSSLFSFFPFEKITLIGQ